MVHRPLLHFKQRLPGYFTYLFCLYRLSKIRKLVFTIWSFDLTRFILLLFILLLLSQTYHLLWPEISFYILYYHFIYIFQQLLVFWSVLVRIVCFLGLYFFKLPNRFNTTLFHQGVIFLQRFWFFGLFGDTSHWNETISWNRSFSFYSSGTILRF